jgi:DNA invertase Pin-like site-specific DNA recombinase
MKVVGYVRVSTTRQAEDGDSIEAQGEVIRAWAEEQGHDVVAVFADPARSGALDAVERPGLLEALEAIEEGVADTLVVHRLDRLARALHVQEAVLARVWSASGDVWEVVGDSLVLRDDPDDPMRTFVRQVMGAANQLERGMTVARMQGGRRRKASRNGYVGGHVPYGWRLVGHGQDAMLVEDLEEQATLSAMKAMRQDDQTYRAIAEALNAEGIPAKNGGDWYHTAVRSTLLAGANA